MAISSYKTFLMYKPTSGNNPAYEKLIDIKSFPDLGGEPELLDTTTLSDKVRTNILGIQEIRSFNFTANYTKEEYSKLAALEGETLDLAVWFGGTESAGTVTPTGSDGKFSFKGLISCYPVGASVNEVVDLNITISTSSPIVWDTTTA